MIATSQDDGVRWTVKAEALAPHRIVPGAGVHGQV
jgi:hypothetical protein